MARSPTSRIGWCPIVLGLERMAHEKPRSMAGSANFGGRAGGLRSDRNWLGRVGAFGQSLGMREEGHWLDCNRATRGWKFAIEDIELTPESRANACVSGETLVCMKQGGTGGFAILANVVLETSHGLLYPSSASRPF